MDTLSTRILFGEEELQFIQNKLNTVKAKLDEEINKISKTVRIPLVFLAVLIKFNVSMQTSAEERKKIQGRITELHTEEFELEQKYSHKRFELLISRQELRM